MYLRQSGALSYVGLFVNVSQQKLWELAKQVSEFLVWRQVICPFDRDRRILQYLVTTPVFTEDGQCRFISFCMSDSTVRCQLGTSSSICLIVAELHLASYESEGPENNMEKDSRRSLRWVETRVSKSLNMQNNLSGTITLVAHVLFFSRSSLLHRENRS